MKKTLIILGCLMFAVFSVQAVEPENKSDKQIEELSKKAFRYSDNKGKQSLKLITGYSGNIENQEWYNDSCFKLCKNNSVTKIISAVLIQVLL